MLRIARAIFKFLNQGWNIALESWPVTIVCLALIFLIGVPGLAADQVRESLLDYFHPESRAWIAWERYALTILTLLLLGGSLSLWGQATMRELEKHRRILAVVWLTPFAVVAIVMFRLFLEMDAYQYLIMAAGTLTLALLPLLIPRTRNWLLGSHQERPLRWQLPSLGLVAVAVLLFGFGGDVSIEIAQAIGPLNLLLLFSFSLGAVLSSLVLAGRRTGIPFTLLLLVGAFVFSYYDLNDNHPVRGEWGDNNLAQFEGTFVAWRAGRPDPTQDRPYPVILVSAEGGGIRAAYFTGITLARIVDHCPRASAHIFAISAVSGGAVGATVFAAAMKADPPNMRDPRCSMSAPTDGRYERRVAAVLQDDLLSPLAARMAFPDFMQRFLPFPVDSFDRQIGFERSLELAFQREFNSDLLTRRFDDLTPDNTSPASPYLLLNTTWVETGERVPVAPFIFQGEDISWINSLQMIEAGFHPRASAAAGMSARFPFVSPAGYIRQTNLKHRYVDGGYIDNSGAEAVMEMFRDLVATHGGTWQSEGEVPSTFILLHIGNAPQCNTSEAPPDPRAAARCNRSMQIPTAGGIGEFLSPLRAAISARDAQSALALSRWEREVTRLLDEGRGQIHETHRIQMYDRGTPIPLGWLLSRRATAELRCQLGAGLEVGCARGAGSDNAGQLAEVVRAIAGQPPG